MRASSRAAGRSRPRRSRRRGRRRRSARPRRRGARALHDLDRRRHAAVGQQQRLLELLPRLSSSGSNAMAWICSPSARRLFCRLSAGAGRGRDGGGAPPRQGSPRRRVEPYEHPLGGAHEVGPLEGRLWLAPRRRPSRGSVRGASVGRPTRSLRSLNCSPSSVYDRSAAHNCRAAPLSPAGSSRSAPIDKRLTAFGAGPAHAFITGCAAGRHGPAARLTRSLATVAAPRPHGAGGETGRGRRRRRPS